MPDDQTINDSGCGCGSHDNKKEIKPFQSTGILIMPSMDNNNFLAEHEKPGYEMAAFVDNFIKTDTGFIPAVKTEISIRDIKSTIRVRIGIGRNDYRIAPGLYCVGAPDQNSEVLVTSNFKLTFDHVRKELSGIDAWILVLDTKGINVWCAAGKGTFSTKELVKRIRLSSLEKVVNHRRVIVPQLGATGVAAGEVKKKSGFRVKYGPVRAADIPEFLKNSRKADKTMREVTFSFVDRIILTPVEINVAIKPALITAIILSILAGIGPDFFSFSNTIERYLILIPALFLGIIAGALVTPALLPYIPFRSFAAKGIITGSLFAVLFSIFNPALSSDKTAFLSIMLFIASVSSYLAMNFTGATPFTSPSGVEKEMKKFIPVQLCALIASTALWFYSIF